MTYKENMKNTHRYRRTLPTTLWVRIALLGMLYQTAGLLPAAGMDSELVFSRVFRSSENFTASPREVALDSAGNPVVVGHGGFKPADFPDSKVNVIGTLDDSSIFVIKHTPAGKLLWVTLIGGSSGTGSGAGRDRGYGLALDNKDNIFIAGGTASTDFPTTQGAFDRSHNGGIPGPLHGASDAYVLKLSPDGTRLLYSTYLGSSANDAARGGLEIDPEGNAYVVGTTGSDDFLKGLKSHINAYAGGSGDGFLAKVSADGSEIIFNRFFGTASATASEVLIGARRGKSGNIFVAGSGGVRTAGNSATDTSINGGGTGDVYVASVSADGQRLAYSTYIGGSGFEGVGHRMAVDDNDNVYISGGTLSPDLPLINASQDHFGGGRADGYLFKIDASGKLRFSTFLGGSKDDTAYGPAVDRQGYIYLTGRTASPDFPVTPNALYREYNGGEYDAFLQVYNPAHELVYSSFLGGNAHDYARNANITSDGTVVMVGHTLSTDFPEIGNLPGADQRRGLSRWFPGLFKTARHGELFITGIKTGLVKQ